MLNSFLILLETFVYYLGGLLLLLVSLSSSLNYLLSAKYSSNLIDRALWHLDLILFSTYWISILYNGIDLSSNILLSLGCLMALIKRRQHLLKTLEAQLEGITYLLVLSFILVDSESAWLISISMLVISVNAGLSKLSSKMWTNFSKVNGLVHFLTTPWLARTMVRHTTQKLSSSRFFLTLVSFLSIATPWIQLSGVLLLVGKVFNISSLIFVTSFLQFSVAIGIFLVCDLKYIPHLYCFLITCFLVLPAPNDLSYLDLTSTLGIFHLLIVSYLLLFTVSSLTPNARPGSPLYEFRKYTMFFSFSAAPLRLFSERDLVNMISFNIIPGSHTKKFIIPFTSDGEKPVQPALISTCKPFCLCYPLSEFCGLSFDGEAHPYPRFLSVNHRNICLSIFMSLRGSSIVFFQHRFNPSTFSYDSFKVASVSIPSDLCDNNMDDSLGLAQFHPIYPLGRLSS